MSIYLDYASTSPLSNDMKTYLESILEVFGNPSSLHNIGQQANSIISNARSQVAHFINANFEEVFFTPGGSASNSAVLSSYDKEKSVMVLYSPIAHKSILECVKHMENACCIELIVDGNGFINIEFLHALLKLYSQSYKSILVVLDYANSEIGTVQNIKEIINISHTYNSHVMLDCTGSISTIPLDVKNLDVDFATFSGHKLGSLKGCGVLYKKQDLELKPFIYGSQEQGLFGGTENVLGIASLGFAASKYDYSKINSISRDYVYHYLKNEVPDCYLVGDLNQRLSHNLYMCFKNIDAESLLLFLDLNEIQVSTGSACNSKSIDVSPTLKAIGLDHNDMHSCIRMTFSGNETIEELDYVCNTLKNGVLTLREINIK